MQVIRNGSDDGGFLPENLKFLKPLMLLSNACGIQHLKMGKRKSIDYIYYLLWLSAHLSLYLYTIKVMWEEKNPTDIPNAYWLLFLSFACFNNIVTITVTLYTQNNFASIIKGISEVDDALKRINMTVNHSKLKKTVTKMMVVGVMITLWDAVCFMLVKEVGIWKKICIVTSSITKGIFLINSLFYYLFGFYFSTITTAKLARRTSGDDLSNEEVNELCVLYSKVRHFTNKVHKNLEVPISNGIIYIICYIFLCLRYTYVKAKEESFNNFQSPLGIVLYVSCFSTMTVDGYIALTHYTYVTQKADGFATSLHVGEISTGNPQSKLNIQSNSLKLLHQKLNFTCFGLFPVDTTLAYSIIGSAVTFILLVVQEDMNL